MGKLIRAVLRGRDGGNTILLPDTLAVALGAAGQERYGVSLQGSCGCPASFTGNTWHT